MDPYEADAGGEVVFVISGAVHDGIDWGRLGTWRASRWLLVTLEDTYA